MPEWTFDWKRISTYFH